MPIELIAEFVAFINGKTLSREGNKLYLASSKDLENQIRELCKEKKWLEAERLSKSSGETINRKKYLDSLLSTRSFSYRYPLLPYLNLVNNAIKQKSNVSTIVKKEMCNKVRLFLKENKLPEKEKVMIQNTVKNWEKSFKEKEWKSYSILEMGGHQEHEIQIGSYEYACKQKIMQYMKKELKKTGLDNEEIEEFISFFGDENKLLSFDLNTSCEIVNNEKPEMKITICLYVFVNALKGYYLAEKFPHGDKILRFEATKNKNYGFDSCIDEDVHFWYELTEEIPLNKILSLSEKEIAEGKLKELLFSVFTEQSEKNKEPKNIEKLEKKELDKIISIKAEQELDKIIVDKLYEVLSSHSNVVTLSAPKLIPLIYRVFTGKKMNR